MRLLAKRHKKLVASTPMRTLAAGNRKLLLRLNRHEWPTKLSLQTHRARAAADHHRQRSGGRPRTRGRGLEHGLDRPDVLPQRANFRASWDRGLESCHGKALRARCPPCDPRSWACSRSLGVLALVGALTLTGVLPGLGVTPRAAAQPASGEPHAADRRLGPGAQRDDDRRHAAGKAPRGE